MDGWHVNGFYNGVNVNDILSKISSNRHNLGYHIWSLMYFLGG